MLYTGIHHTKKLLGGLLFCSFSIFTHAQTPRPVPASYPSNTKVNYIRVWEAKAPEQNATTLKTRGLRDLQQTTQYFDGLGRPLQTVVKQGSLATDPLNPISSANAVDLVSTVLYDEFGREQYTYLPFASTATDATKNNGSFKLNPFAQQVAFYNTYLDGQAGETSIGTNGENWAYSKTNYEPSPLNRVVNTYAPGVSWVGSEGGGTEALKKNVRIKYYSNTGTDNVKIWKVTGGGGDGTWGGYALDLSAGITRAGVYDDGTLYKTITIDENDKQVIEFKDKEGRVILKKVQLTGSDDTGAGQGYTGWMCTYYLYDDLGNLRCVMQPEAIQKLSQTSWAVTTALINEQFFCYEYDERRRMIMKKVPGVTAANAVYMVYDARDRLVMTQDGKQRALSPQVWLTISYDELNRPIQTGAVLSTYSVISGKTFNQILTAAAASTAYPFDPASAPSSTYYTLLTQTGYDNYDGMSAAGSPFTSAFDNTYNNATYIHTTYNTSPLYAQPLVQSLQTRGLPTWTRVRILGYDYFEYTVNIYDDKARIIQVKKRNYSGGQSLITTQYNWAGQPLRIIQKHHKTLHTVHTSVVVTDMSYDDLGRAILTQKKIGNNLVSSGALPAAWTTIATNEYDALGQLKTKNLGKKRNTDGTYSADVLAKLEYSYNIRGWLLSINKGYMGNSNTDQYFAMELGYDKDPGTGNGGTKQYNGNISSILWKSEGDQQRRKYNFSYDATNRLTAASFGQYVSGSGASAVFNTSAGIDFSVSGLGYDYNGNITAMTQNGLKLNASAPIDKLIYTYESGSNRLQKVTEDPSIVAATNGMLGDFKDGSNGTAADYTYNHNGSMTADKNKDITSISYYSTVELPNIVTTPKGTITYVYDALGVKSWKKTIDNSTTGKTITTNSKNIEGFAYESKAIAPADPDNPNYDDKLQFAIHEEGRIRAVYNNAATPNTPTGFVYDYFLKDHLGNIRMVLTDEFKQDIYPAATLEGDINTDGSPNAAFIEKNYYTIDPSKIVPKTDATGITPYENNNGSLIPNNNPNSVTGNTSEKLYKLEASSTAGETGLGITLKVMAGDKIDILGNSYYFTNVTNGGTNNKDITTLSILAGLLGGPTGGSAAGAHGGVTAGQLDGFASTTDGISSLFADQLDEIPNSSAKPRAFINYIFFDEQFKSVGSGFDPVGDNSVVTPHHLQQKVAPKNGYVYIYVSNQSQVKVFFDNLQVIHTRGAILEETHYYPFGLTMAAISSKALNGIAENKYKFVGQELSSNEFSDNTGLNWYEFKFRTYDYQIGRFIQVDPLAYKYVYNSTYAYAENRPINGIDLEGLEFFETISIAPGKLQKNWTINLKVVNSDLGNDDAKLANRMSAAKEAIEKTFSGKDSEGYDITTTVNMTLDPNADFSKDFILHYVQDLPALPDIKIPGSKIKISGRPDAAAHTEKIGDVISNIFTVVSTDVMQSANNFTDDETRQKDAYSTAHELGHGGGLKHNGIEGNLMNSYRTTLEGRLTPEQRTIISNLIQASGNSKKEKEK